eukprot:IDg11601t1
MFVLWIIWLIFSRIIKLCYYLIEKPMRVFSMPAFIVWQYIAACIKIYAMVTCYNRTWGTRDITVKDGEVVRTKAGAANAATLLAGEKEDDDSPTGDTDEFSDSGSADTSATDPPHGEDGKPVHRIPFHLHPTIERDDFGRGHVNGKTRNDVRVNVDEISAGPTRV